MGSDHDSFIKPHEDRFEKNEKNIEKLFSLYGKITSPTGYLHDLEIALGNKVNEEDRILRKEISDVKDKLDSKFNWILILLASNLLAVVIKLAMRFFPDSP